MEVSRELEDPAIWNNPEKAQALGRERAQLEQAVNVLTDLQSGLGESEELLELAAAEDDSSTVDAVLADLDRLETSLEKLEFRRMFSGEMDPNNAFLEVQAGSGGT